jgi:molecular chaperone DnaK (HSP70)
MKKEWKNPFWETAAKDRLTVRLNITHDDGSFSTSVARVSKFDENGNITSDYNELMEQNSLEAIDKFTDERLERHRQEREARVKKQQERNEAKRLEDLFNAKLATFEIPEIKESTNRKMKAKIRKAKNQVEMQAYATILLMEIMNESSEGTN